MFSPFFIFIIKYKFVEKLNIKEILLAKLIVLSLIWVSASLIFQLTMIGFHFTNNQPAIKKVNNWFNNNIDGHFKKV